MKSMLPWSNGNKRAWGGAEKKPDKSNEENIEPVSTQIQ